MLKHSLVKEAVEAPLLAIPEDRLGDTDNTT